MEGWERRLKRTKVVKFGGSPRRMGPAVERFAADIRQGRIHPTTTLACVAM